MNPWDQVLFLFNGEQAIRLWFALFLGAGVIAGVWTGFFRARKIQPRGFKWKTFRNEGLFAVLNVAISGALIGGAMSWLLAHGWISVAKGPVSWWQVAIQYALYFFLFDTWFYWLHRWMHNEPVYSWVHKLHHFSTSPNLLTTFSVNPLESLVNGGFVPLFLTAMAFVWPVHDHTMALITPTNVLMGLYVHSGYEFLPRWWNRSWATKWFITATFHDQHHKYFRVNFGGYTTIWDRLCGTMRPKYEDEMAAIGDRSSTTPPRGAVAS
ncbi:sterol desaturase family protein [Novosphingobium flavum]|uniref:sterol desaturase family protein n=1 Tax=Novosphingobium aerophilum TaxID=2839843 RepID=UPI00163B192F|nr:sterol desaturase family protein [Novosphingobium aerophilum]MBC2660319.1 sterol desaturase family protein [Novosphingobium aerophilum]